MKTSAELESILRRINRRGYKAYKDIAGAYDLGPCLLFIDHVQGDPFAAPSRVRLRVPAEQASFPRSLHSNRIRRIALQDYIVRAAFAEARALQHKIPVRGSGKSGVLEIDVGGQEILERTAALVSDRFVELRMSVGLPAAGRTILGDEASALLLRLLPALARKSLYYPALDQNRVAEFVNLVDNYYFIQRSLSERRLVAFIADGSVLPRAAGNTQLPMERDRAVRFTSPPGLRVSFSLPNPLPALWGGGTEISGMGLPEGITLIVGGGFHGKSTLLDSLARGVYPHIPGDGRELVVTRPDAVTIRAEDGRRVEKVDISPFITNLPGGRTTDCFCTDNASGSTSQAANIIEALEAGSRLLLLDEDTSATNFMVRDARMQALIHKDHEPITPFIDRAREMYQRLGVSSILVMGGCGDYLDIADTVLLMKEYRPELVTEQARAVARQIPTTRVPEAPHPFTHIGHRIPLPDSIDPSRGRKPVKIDVRGLDYIRFGRHEIDLRQVEQLVDPSQARAAGYAIYLAAIRAMDGRRDLPAVLDWLEQTLDEQSLDVLSPGRRPESHPGNFARPRRYEIAAALNRLRTFKARPLP